MDMCSEIAARSRVSSLCLGIVFLGLCVSGYAAQQPPASQVLALDPAVVARGKGDFASSCSFCHGGQATGTEQAPNLLRSPLLTDDHGGNVLVPFLKVGRPTLGMPSFASLPQQQLAEIVVFLHARLLETRSNRLPETALLVGNATAGKAYFKATGRCSTCHSETGDLAGIGRRYQPLALTTAFLTPAAKPLKVTVTLPTGEKVTGRMEYTDEFTISITDDRGTYHSWPRDRVKAVEVTDPLSAHKDLLLQYTDKDIHNVLAYLVTLK
jgi:cytochrome c oxidase cbb3-type subunit 3